MSKWLTGATVLVAALIFSAPQAGAAVALNSGDVVGGWRISFPSGIGLFSDGITTDNQTLVLEKVANFTDSAHDGVVEGLQIVFSQVEENAVPFIEISDENITNNTGLPWQAFQFSLASADIAAGDPEFTSVFDKISPFNDVDFSSNFIELNDGIVDVGETIFLGTGVDGGELTIAASPSSGVDRVFSFKEQPIPIPLPAAAWMGLVGLLGAGALSRKAKLA